MNVFNPRGTPTCAERAAHTTPRAQHEETCYSVGRLRDGVVESATGFLVSAHDDWSKHCWAVAEDSVSKPLTARLFTFRSPQSNADSPPLRALVVL